MYLRENFKVFTEKVKNRLYVVEKQLMTCPQGRLYGEHHYGKEYFYEEIVVSGKRKRHALTKNPEKITQLIRKDLLLKESEYLEEDLRVLENALNLLKDFDPGKYVDKLIEKYPELDEEIVSGALKDDAMDLWQNSKYESLVFHEEEKRHRTSKGLKVRTKSELLIAEKLYEYGVPFRYEQLLYYDDDKYLAPDFTIKKPDGSLYYWEHEGLTNNKKYLEKQVWKSQIYASLNIVPWKNFIVTYDNEDGNIDIRIIESEIINKLLD